jgi:hypothetical protein
MTPRRQLEKFIARFTPGIAVQARAILRRLRALLPGAFELVYDNYNALVIGFGPTERAGDAPFSIALYPRWVNLFFLHGALLKDPSKRLRGEGVRVRHIRLEGAATLDEPDVRALIAQARKGTPLDLHQPRRILIKAIAAKQRPRR